jgi:hypothetical protein
MKNKCYREKDRERQGEKKIKKLIKMRKLKKNEKTELLKQSIRILKKPIGSVYKPETEKTEPNSNRKN